MISMTGWHVDIPLHYTIGFQGENNVNRFDIVHDNEDQYTYQLDVHFIDKEHLIDYRNIFNLELSDNVLSLVFKKEMLPYNGKYEFQVVGYKDTDIIKKSNIFCAQVQSSINADGSWDPLPDAFEELREEILEARDTASQAAEDAVDALGKTNKVIDGIWYVWDSSTQEYVSTGEPARGPEGPEGQKGTSATIRVGSVSTGDPGSDASITNSGDSSKAVFDFVIPRGDRGPAGTTLYSDLSDKPTINGVEVSGDKTSEDYKIGSVQSDWNQNDESAPDYVKNRPIYLDTEIIQWDGTIGDNYKVEIPESGGMVYYKLTDSTPGFIDIINTFTVNGIPVPKPETIPGINNIIFIQTQDSVIFLCVYEDNTDVSGVMPGLLFKEKGLYVVAPASPLVISFAKYAFNPAYSGSVCSIPSWTVGETFLFDSHKGDKIDVTIYVGGADYFKNFKSYAMFINGRLFSMGLDEIYFSITSDYGAVVNVLSVKPIITGDKVEFEIITDGTGVLTPKFNESTDEGKILKIVGGVPTWVSLQSAEEVSF